jgi:hypothetical protein
MTILFTAVIAVTGVIGALIFNNQLSVMHGQLGEMQAERRPWISIEVTGHNGIVWDERGARLSVVFKLKNVGKTPATNVFFEAKTILPKVGGPAIPTQAMLDYAAISDDVAPWGISRAKPISPTRPTHAEWRCSSTGRSS